MRSTTVPAVMASSRKEMGPSEASDTGQTIRTP